jgi:ribosomal protein S18 acetylase RimI-like enzyme
MEAAITLQLARERDAAAISRMSAALIEQDLPQAWTPERVLGHIRRSESVVLIAKSGQQLIGFAIMQFAEDSAHLNLLAVTKASRRRGIARQMLNWLHESAVVAGTFRIRLELRSGNEPARRFYVSMGYEECGYVTGYYSAVEDAVRMTKDLTAVTPPPPQ